MIVDSDSCCAGCHLLSCCIYMVYCTFSGFDQFSNPPLQDSVWIYRICWNKDAFCWYINDELCMLITRAESRRQTVHELHVCIHILDYLKKCRGKWLSIIFVHIEEYWGFVDLQFRISLLFWQSTRLTTSDAPCCWTVDWGWVVKNCDAHDKIALHHTEDGKAPFFFGPFWVASRELMIIETTHFQGR